MNAASDATSPGAAPPTLQGPDAPPVDRGSAPTMLQTDTPPPALADESASSRGWIGRVIDERYRIVEVLGEGGMGAVFVAENLNLRKQVALKVIRSEFATDEQIAARFAREAMATASLDHPHVVSALDHGPLPEGGAYLVIQLVRGRSLRSILERRALPWPQACEVVAQIADALAAAHQAGIVHRDLKPDNVLLERQGDTRYHVRVVDFGIARVAGEIQQNVREGLTRTGMVMGTPGYMAPEQAMGEEVDHRADLYALGVVLWECIAGRPLWEAESLPELIARQLGESPPPLHTVVGQPVPELLDQLVAQLVARAPKGRPEGAAPIRDALKKLSLGAVEGILPAVGAPGLGAARRTERAPTLTTGLRPGPWTPALTWLEGHWRADRRRVLTIAGAFLFLVAIALPLAVAALSGGGDEDAPLPGLPVVAAPPPSVVTDQASRAAQAVQPSDEALAHIDIVLNTADANARAYSAGQVRELAASEPIPEYALQVAELELATRCSTKRPWVEAIAAAGDPRTLPALRRLAALPKDGCGNWFNRSDCLACLRKQLDAAIDDLSKKTP